MGFNKYFIFWQLYVFTKKHVEDNSNFKKSNQNVAII